MAQRFLSSLLTTRDSPPLHVELALLVARVFAGLALALGHGLGKMPPAERFVDAVAGLGFPAPALFAWAAALSELAGGLLLAVGLLVRPAALFVATTMAVAAFGAHAADPFARREMSLLFLVLALIFLARGGGRFSLDRLAARGLR